MNELFRDGMSDVCYSKMLRVVVRGLHMLFAESMRLERSPNRNWRRQPGIPRKTTKSASLNNVQKREKGRKTWAFRNIQLTHCRGIFCHQTGQKKGQ